MTRRHVHKDCSICRKSKPLTAYRLKPNGDPEAACSACRDKRVRSANKVAYNRARQRAIAELAADRAAEVDALTAKWLPIVRAEMEALGGADVKIRPGKRLKGQTAADRIRELCPNCASFHDAGHECPKCAARAARLAEVAGDDKAARDARLRAVNARIMAERADRARAATTR